MKKLSLALTIALSIAAMAVLGAQQTSSQTSQTSQTSQSMTKGSTVTVTGCVEQASALKPTGTSGGATTAMTPDTKFVLTSKGSDMSSSTTGTSGTMSPSSKVTYRLDDADQAKISEHEGHKVEITGTVLEEGQGMQAGQTAQAGQEEKGETASAHRVPKIKVDSVKMISSSCTQQQ